MDTPRIYAHRGASADAAENTLAAFGLARTQRADGVELDVRRSADGAPVIHHDASLPDGRLVVETPQSALPASVPTLEEALEECLGLVVNVEIKNSPNDPDHDPGRSLAAEVVDLLGQRGRDHVLVSSFDVGTVDRVRSLAPEIDTGVLVFIDPTPAAAIELATARGHRSVHPHEFSVDAAYLARAHDAGLAVNTWTVDDPGRIRELAGLGVDGIITNVPAVARHALGG